ncbi:MULTISPECIES: type II toxin-antitoxin system RelE/ParE family toxin [Brenneria]|uniref:Type II toxin-antitoxin system RelE/ParE family toxin n=1 Tax=Brenneria nigrifluens DSM 30175 = ATCC 13028 TaxID=1121120 RepID=A0A2U1UJU5_9GAMM|nr:MULTISPECIES: type II toxin-antitoxin system RelE/ParE family toxin [Brenneria]EHD20929.1 plasmid stabilization system [Brenneria sp. EniD312]PWC21923.1 type II toxin-antitoxin system RelE/ParE family toxin [Brenneria nigrifluens DSM 30175 = ATCC 13028]QCR04090.1 type II toxin-antitoxin system RelE/ParE family toxin [Brenneria nigrifluens DSM 30175 = ATCC 13028]
MTPHKIHYTQTFKNQLYDRFHYLTRHIGPEASAELLERFIGNFEARIADYPQSAPICEETADLGLTHYHDYVYPKLQLRVIYRIDAANGVVFGMLFLSTRQSIREALIQYCLRRE